MTSDTPTSWPSYCGVCLVWLGEAETWTERGSHIVPAQVAPDIPNAGVVAAPGGVLQRCMECDTVTNNNLTYLEAEYDLVPEDLIRWIEQGLPPIQIRELGEGIRRWAGPEIQHDDD